MLTIRQQIARGPGGGKIVRKRIQRKFLYELAQAQQYTINQLSEQVFALKKVLTQQQQELSFVKAVHTPRSDGQPVEVSV